MKIKAMIVDDFQFESRHEWLPNKDLSKHIYVGGEIWITVDDVNIQVPRTSMFVTLDTDEIKRQGIEEADKLYKRIMNMPWDDRRKAFGSADLFTVIPNNTYDELSEKLAAYDRKRKAEAKELIHRLEDLGYKVTVEEKEKETCL